MCTGAKWRTTFQRRVSRGHRDGELVGGANVTSMSSEYVRFRVTASAARGCRATMRSGRAQHACRSTTRMGSQVQGSDRLWWNWCAGARFAGARHTMEPDCESGMDWRERRAARRMGGHSARNFCKTQWRPSSWAPPGFARWPPRATTSESQNSVVTKVR